MRLGVLVHRRRHRLVEERQVELRDVDELVLRVLALEAMAWTQRATALPLRPGRVLPL